MSTTLYTNVSTYLFAPLSDLKSLRERLMERTAALGLKGTILLSPEGINLFIAGTREAVDALLEFIRTVPGLEELKPKYSESNHQPFNRMLVRLKKEIIAFGVAGIDPARRTAPKIAPQTLKQWLDEGRPVTLLDTRNDYEVKLGTFRHALPAGITHFRDFPNAVRQLPASLKDQPVVMFCTGGIRCEKAGPFMEMEGFKHIYQLDGGILKYFEECGGAHYDGECFVFDQRVGVDPALRETSARVCHNCLAPLTEDDQKHPQYQPPHSCPYCYQSIEQQRAVRLQRRQEALRLAGTPLPGAHPRDNFRPLNVPAVHDGKPLLEFLCALFPHIPREQWQATCDEGHIMSIERKPLSADHRVRAGERCLHLKPGQVEPDVNAAIELLYEDEALVILNKPAPLPMHPGGRFFRNTLQEILHAAYAPLKPRPAHRLDANTTGLVVCARTHQMAGKVQPQFAKGLVKKTYLVKVNGHPPLEHFSCDAPITNEPTKTGCRLVDWDNGQSALTEFSIISRDVGAGTTLLEAHPLTGRTNQIRIHLRHLGFPVCGERSYLADGIGQVQTLALGEPPLCLHAWRVEFNHPMTGKVVAFEAPVPVWARP
ncbi:MAG: sulfurtransferase [Verrucomicrobiota bacterium]|nr:sulfurtransferase [Verrucomicrobiota bacterium]